MEEKKGHTAQDWFEKKHWGNLQGFQLEMSKKELKNKKKAKKKRKKLGLDNASTSSLIPYDEAHNGFKQSHAQLEEAVTLHDQGIEGDKEAVVKAQELLQQIRQEVQDPLIEAYYGSATCLLGRDAINPNVRMAKALSGLKVLDQAVKTAPGHVDIRVLRSQVCFRLPEKYFHRSTTAINDFCQLIYWYEQDRELFSQDFYEQCLIDLGDAYQNVGNKKKAQAIWQQGLTVTKDPKHSKTLKKRLNS
ncbi:hypothetical protein F9B85_12235 [Heliorestis acidaminivorans]|uniref:Tetratricopeptide repeat protein n=1 Tax=Heliorestis acidaminivorans TaxID=553427 RepID=A0A6I0ES31_9FIRM|nr:hypothetical protein [Heliorestis acidaminivorans]KAB2951565.1 hypothetical protein F9B85_12235 [Heliorestis acidaminivorans]